MGLSLSMVRETVFGNRRVKVVDVTFDSSYPTNGESLTPANLGLQQIDLVLPAPAAGYMFEYDHSNQKLKAFTPTKAQSAHSHTATTGSLLMVMPGGDVKGSANTNSENADAAALPTNGALVGAATAVAAGAYTFPATAHPDRGRNVCIVVVNDSGGALNLYEGVSTFTVTGTWRGAAQSETITFTSSAGNKAVANSKYRYKYGAKPFDTVTAVTVDNVPDNNLKIAVGIGSKIGLASDLLTPLEADVTKITKNAANLAVTSTVDTTNMTVNLGTLADGDDFEITYKGKSPVLSLATGGTISASAASEVANTTDLSAVTCRLIAIGV